MTNLLDMTQFNIPQLDANGKKVFDDFITRFIELRKKKVSLPDEFYNMATEFYVTSCAAQTKIPKKVLNHFIEVFSKDANVGSEINGITTMQKREDLFRDFVDAQIRQGNRMPWKHVGWRRIKFFFKWIPPSGVFTYAYYLITAPGAIVDKVRVKLFKKTSEANTAAADTNPGDINVEDIKCDQTKPEFTYLGRVMQVRAGARVTTTKTENSAEIPLDGGADAVLNALESVETGDRKQSDETPDAQNAQEDTQAKAEAQPAAASKQPPPDAPLKPPERSGTSAPSESKSRKPDVRGVPDEVIAKIAAEVKSGKK